MCILLGFVWNGHFLRDKLVHGLYKVPIHTTISLKS